MRTALLGLALALLIGCGEGPPPADASIGDTPAYASIGDTLTLGSTAFTVTGVVARKSFPVEGGLTVSAPPGKMFLDVIITVFSQADLDGAVAAGTFRFYGDGTPYGSLTRPSDSIVAAGTTRSVTKTYSVPRYNLLSGGMQLRLRIQDLFSDSTGVVDLAGFSEAATPTVERLAAIASTVDEFLTDGSIDNRSTAENMQRFLSNAEADIRDYQNTTAQRTLEAFIRSVQARAGRRITPSAAQTLIDMTQAVIDSLGG